MQDFQGYKNVALTVPCPVDLAHTTSTEFFVQFKAPNLINSSCFSSKSLFLENCTQITHLSKPPRNQTVQLLVRSRISTNHCFIQFGWNDFYIFVLH